jgi:anti-anti-sigma regulatory factor
MSSPAANLSVWVGDQVVCVKISGRASFNCSVDFRTLLTTLWRQGRNRFVLDLTKCQLMDSTFLGVLAGRLALQPGTKRLRTGPDRTAQSQSPAH